MARPCFFLYQVHMARKRSNIKVTFLNPFPNKLWPHDYGPMIIKVFFMLNSAEHEISMLDKSHLINLQEEHLIYRIFIVSAYQIKLLNLISRTLISIIETLKFEHKLS